MKLYTKSGDKGNTSLIGGKRIKKSDPRVRAYGSIDEVNAWVGEIRAELGVEFQAVRDQLLHLQILLFDVGTDVATPNGTQKFLVDQGSVRTVEYYIDYYDEKVTPIEKFVLPGGNIHASHFQIVRTVTRRAERELAELLSMGAAVNKYAYQVVNRLSDLFFLLARYMNQVHSVQENFYEKAGKVFH